MNNAREVLVEVEKLIAEGRTYYVRSVCTRLSIFDWWKPTLTQSHLKKMKSFLENAIKLGYTGYVCFNVGDYGCSNGMWAYKNESENGYSPKGDFLYRTFVYQRQYWEVYKNGEGSGELTFNEMKKFLKK